MMSGVSGVLKHHDEGGVSSIFLLPMQTLVSQVFLLEAGQQGTLQRSC